MNEDISEQLFQQTTTGIQKLFELNTRTDERIKGLQARVKRIQEEIDDLSEKTEGNSKDVAILGVGSGSGSSVAGQLTTCQAALVEIDKRLIMVESNLKGSEGRWDKVVNFIVQLAWVLIAGWLLATLNLPSPP